MTKSIWFLANLNFHWVADFVYRSRMQYIDGDLNLEVRTKIVGGDLKQVVVLLGALSRTVLDNVTHIILITPFRTVGHC